MGNRLSKIVTRTGDAGETGLADGSRLSKASARIAAIGDCDELNSWLGLLLCHALPPQQHLELQQMQHLLFEFGGELAYPVTARLEEADLAWLEACIASNNQALPPLKEFILPGGSMAVSHCHLARVCCRRLERTLVQLRQEDPAPGFPLQLPFINRLSDYLFVLSRLLLQQEGLAPVLWKNRHQRGRRSDPG